MIKKIHFFALEVAKPTSRLIFWRKTKFHFLDFFSCRFTFLQALEKNVFQNFKSLISQLSHAFSRDKKYTKFAILS